MRNRKFAVVVLLALLSGLACSSTLWGETVRKPLRSSESIT